LTEAAVEDETSQESFALRLTAALEAIQQAQEPVVPAPGAAAPGSATPGPTRAYAPPATPRPASVPRFGRKSGEESPVDSFERTTSEELSVGPSGRERSLEASAPEKAPRNDGALSTYVKLLDKLPPIRLPIGPAVPWRIALPSLVGLLAVMVLVNRPATVAQPQALPAASPAATPVATSASLADQQARQIINSSSAQADTTTPDPSVPVQTNPTTVAQPLGVADSAGLGFDFVDLGVKLAAVLGLAYGSLLLLKKAGIGGAGGGLRGPDGTRQGLQVVSSLVLAPNRSVHVLKVPGGKTLLVGATPTQVNLISELSEEDKIN
jgi:flagellar biogenesis protein FliO